jgi:hypothetical protein
MAEAYCMKCKTKRKMKDPKKVTMKNGRPATKGVCPTCGTGMYKIGGGEGGSSGGRRRSHSGGKVRRRSSGRKR